MSSPEPRLVIVRALLRCQCEHFAVWRVLVALLLLVPLVHAARGDELPSDSTARFTFQPASLEELAAAVRSGLYVPVSREALRLLMEQQDPERFPVAPMQPVVQVAEYSAVLDGQTLTEGRLRFSLDAAARFPAAGAVVLGQTNLQRLTLTSHGKRLSLVAPSNGELAILSLPAFGSVDGTWEYQGRAEQTETRFDLQLPDCVLSSFRLRTKPGVRITSPNALITKERETPGAEHWVLFPRNHRELSLICSTNDQEHSSAPVPALALQSEFVCSEEILDAVWTVGIGEEVPRGEFQFEFSAPCDVTEAVLDDGTSLTVTLLSESPTKIAVASPLLSRSTTLTLLGHAELHTGKPTALPLIIPATFRPLSERNAVHPGILQSRVQLSVPPFLTVRDLNLSGAQQRDVSFSSSGNQLLQLFQFETTATASITVDETVPLLHQDLMFQLGYNEDPGNVRAYARIRALTGSAAELSWQLPDDWRATDVREVRSNLPLFFETRPSAAPNAATLTIHLRSPVTAEFDARISVDLRSTKLSAIAPRTIPQLVNADYRRGRFVYAATRPETLSQFPAQQFRTRPGDSSIMAEFDWLPDNVSSRDSAYLEQISPAAPDQAPSAIEAPPEPLLPPAESVSSSTPGPDQNAGDATATGPRSEVGGTLFSIADESPGTLRLENLAALNIAGTCSAGRLEFRITGAKVTETGRPFATVNGRAAVVKREDDWYTVLVPQDAASVDFQLHWTSEVPQSLWTGSVIASCPLTFRDLAVGTISRRILVPAGTTIEQQTSNDRAMILVRTRAGAATVPDFGASGRVASEDSEVTDPATAFRCRWLLGSGGDASLYSLVPTIPEADSTALTVYSPRLKSVLIAAGTLVGALLVVGLRMFRSSGHRRLLLLLVILLSARTALPPLPLVVADTLVLCFSVAAVLSVLQPLIQMLKAREQSAPRGLSARSVMQSAVLICCLPLASAYAQDAQTPSAEFTPAARLSVLVPDFVDSTFPIVFVPRHMLGEEAAAVRSGFSTSVYVSSVDVSVTCDDHGTAVAMIDAQIFRDAAVSETVLLIPLQDATLTACEIDGQQVLPRLDTQGQILLPLPSTAKVVPRPLQPGDADADLTSSAGPPQGTDWLNHAVRYEMRVRSRQSGSTIRFALPLPASPMTQITLPAGAKAIREATVQSDRVHSAEIMENGDLSFPPLFHAAGVTVTLRLSQSDNTVAETAGTAELTCLAEVTPNQTRVNGSYHITSTSALPDVVQIGLPAGFVVSGIRDTDGVSVPWSVREGEIRVGNDDPNRTEWKFSVTLNSVNRSPALTQSVDIGRLAEVTGAKCDDVIFAVRTVSPFVLREVTAAGRRLNDTPLAASARDAAGLRAADRTFRIGPNTSTVLVELAEQTVTREARVIQQATVKADSVAWNCRCEIEVSGAPVFRQNIRLDGDLLLTSVTATASDTRRLQSYSFSNSMLTVAFREGTRGTLRITVEGSIPIRGSDPVELPVIGLPDAEILESSLLLNAEQPRRAFISDLAGAVPDSPILIEQTPLTAAPFRMTITQEDRPLSLRVEPVIVPQAEVFLITTATDNPQTAHVVIQLSELSDSEPTLIRLPPGGAQARRVSLIQRGIIQSLASADRPIGITAVPAGSATNATSATLVVANLSVQRESAGTVSCQLPTFESEVRAELPRVLDFSNASQGDSDAPDAIDPASLASVMNALQLADALPLQPVPTIVPAAYDPFSRQVQFQPATVKLRTPDQGPPQPFAYAVAATQVNVSDQTAITGVTHILAFHAQDADAISVSIPAPLIVQQIRCNGSFVHHDDRSKRIPVAPGHTASVVEIRWLIPGKVTSLLLSSAETSWPRISSGRQVDFVRFAVQSGMTVAPAETTPQVAVAEMPSILLQSIQVGAAQAQLEVQSVAADAAGDSFLRGGLPLEFGGFLISKSPPGSDSTDRDLALQVSLSDQLRDSGVWYAPNASRIEWNVRRTVLPLEGFAVVSVAALAIMWLTRRRPTQRNPPASSEASTVISRDAAVAEALIDSRETPVPEE